MKRHHLTCLKRLTNNVFDSEDDSFSNSSGVSDVNVDSAYCRVPPIHFPPAPIQNRQRRHMNVGLSRNFPCDICGRPHGNMAELNEHRRVHSTVISRLPTEMSNDFASVTLTKYAFGGHACEYDLVSHEPCSDAMQFFQMSASLIKNLISSLSTTYTLQGRMVARARFFQLNDAGERVAESFLFFPSHAQSFIHDGEEWYTSHSNRIIERLDTVLRNSSDLDFDSIERVYVKLIIRENVDGQGIFQLPPTLENKRQAIVNVDATSECFKFALLSILHYNDVSNRQRTNPNSYREWVGELNFGDLNVNNININDISRIERLNNLKINVHVWEAGKLTIRYNNPSTIAPKTVNMLLVCKRDSRHYCGIISLIKLYYGIVTSQKRCTEFCERCCRHFSSWRNKSQGVKETLEEHYQFCRERRL